MRGHERYGRSQRGPGTDRAQLGGGRSVRHGLPHERLGHRGLPGRIACLRPGGRRVGPGPVRGGERVRLRGLPDPVGGVPAVMGRRGLLHRHPELREPRVRHGALHDGRWRGGRARPRHGAELHGHAWRPSPSAGRQERPSSPPSEPIWHGDRTRPGRLERGIRRVSRTRRSDGSSDRWAGRPEPAETGPGPSMRRLPSRSPRSCPASTGGWNTRSRGSCPPGR